MTVAPPLAFSVGYPDAQLTAIVLAVAPARATHSACLDSRLKWVTASGQDTVLSYIEYHRSGIRGYDGHLPNTVAIVELDEGPRVISALVGATSDRGAAGAAARAPVFGDDPTRSQPA